MNPTREERDWLIMRLDWFYNFGTCVSKSLNEGIPFNAIKETYSLARKQLLKLYTDNYSCIINDDAIYNYYVCAVGEFEFIDNMITPY